jgi:hypothetical protein
MDWMKRHNRRLFNAVVANGFKSIIIRRKLYVGNRPTEECGWSDWIACDLNQTNVAGIDVDLREWYSGNGEEWH